MLEPRFMMQRLLTTGLASIIAFILLGCDQGPAEEQAASGKPVSQQTPPEETQPEATEPDPVSHDGPKIEFARLTHDFGVIDDVRKVSCSFDFVNAGDQVLRIENVTTTCGCTVPTLEKKIFRPGEGSEIDVTYDPSGRGAKTRLLKITTNAVNGDPPGYFELTMNSFIKPFIVVEPEYLRLNEIELGRRQILSFSVSCHDPEMEIERLEPSTPYLSARVLTHPSMKMYPPEQEGWRHYEVELILSDDAPWGIFTENVKVHCRGRLEEGAQPIQHTVSAKVIAKIHGELAPSNDRFRLSILRPNEPFSTAVVLRRKTNQPFTIYRTRLEGDLSNAMKLEVKPVGSEPATAYNLVIRGNTGSFVGQIRGMVTIDTDVPGEETITIPYSGVSKVD
jgi:hypothetical protein